MAPRGAWKGEELATLIMTMIMIVLVATKMMVMMKTRMMMICIIVFTSTFLRVRNFIPKSKFEREKMSLDKTVYIILGEYLVFGM